MEYLPTLTDVQEQVVISVLYILVVSIIADITVNEP